MAGRDTSKHLRRMELIQPPTHQRQTLGLEEKVGAKEAILNTVYSSTPSTIIQ